MTPEERKHWLEMADYHARECTYMQACCRMATREGTHAIRQLITAIAEEREACARIGYTEGSDTEVPDAQRPGAIIAAKIRART